MKRLRTFGGCWALVLLITSCTRPGVRGEGRARVEWAGEAPWNGRCVYLVATRWATELPHVLRMEDEGSDGALVISSRRPFQVGATRIPRTGGSALQGIAMDGSTVRGALEGTLDVSEQADSTTFVLQGIRAYRDTVSFRARCRIVRVGVD